MNTDSPREHDDVQDHADRLTHQALEEVVGGQRPPDLSQQILNQAVLPARPVGWRRLGMWAAAAALVLACGAVAMWPEGRRYVSQRMRSRDAKLVEHAAVEPSGNSESAAVYAMDEMEALDREQDFSELLDGVATTAPAQAPAPTEPALDPATARPAARPPVNVSSKPFSGDRPVELESAAPGRFDEGRGPGQGGDRYGRLYENPFLAVAQNPLSTFSIDVDTASYAKVRRYLMENNMLPPPDAVRLEELINYFPYQDAPPEDGQTPFAVRAEVADCPWQRDHRLLRVAIKGREVPDEQRPAGNLVFLLDVSGSMDAPDRLPRVKRAMKALVERLGENDQVAIVVYAGASGLVLPPTNCSRKAEILAALDALNAGGSTNGGAGIQLAYRTALEKFIPGGVNRVILCTDGDFNVGTTSDANLVRLVEENARSHVFLTVLGFGMGNHNDQMLEEISNKGNGNYFYIDSDREAQKVLLEQLGGTLVTIAKDVKIQVEFNPAQVGAYRLLGYENRMLRAEDFNDDTKDAGEIGAGHTVVALYELVPAGKPFPVPGVDELKYQKPAPPAAEPASDELLTVKLRFKPPTGDVSEKIEMPVRDSEKDFDGASEDFRFAAAVAGFGLLLRDSQYKGDIDWATLAEVAASARDFDPQGYRAEFVELVRKAQQLSR